MFSNLNFSTICIHFVNVCEFEWFRMIGSGIKFEMYETGKVDEHEDV